MPHGDALMDVPPVFATERLCLRPFQPRDLPYLEAYALRESFWRYLPLDPQTPETVRAFLESRLNDRWGEGGFNCAVELSEAGHLIGTLRLSVSDATHRSGDLGYALNDDFSGLGYMTEAVSRIMQVGFDILGLHRIWAVADVENTGSWRLMERAGMKREGKLRANKLKRGEWCDSYLYARLASDQPDKAGQGR